MNFKQLSAPLTLGIAALTLAGLTGCGSGGGGNNGGSGGSGSGGSGLAVSKSFYPLTDASGAALSWTYDATSATRSRAAAGNSFTVTYQGATTFNGRTVDKFSAYSGASVSYLELSDVGVAYAGGQFNGVATPLWGNDWYIRYALSPGQTEEFTSRVGNAAGSFHYKITRLADQSVATPAGTYACAVYQRTTIGVTGIAANDYSPGDVDTYWYAPQVGLVKDTFAYSDGTTSTDTLRSYGAETTGTGGTAPNPAPPH